MTRSSALPSFAGVVPGAGASRRMGSTKALLTLGNETFLARVVRSLSEGGCDPVFVVVSEADGAVAEVARNAGARVIENPSPGDGPITSLRIALEAIDDTVDGIAYLPLDHPLVKADTVAALLQAARSSGSQLVLPIHGLKRGHPAIFRRSLFEELLDPGLEGGARIVVHRHLDSAFLLESDDPGVTTDIDTREAYAEALLAYQARAEAVIQSRPAEASP